MAEVDNLLNHKNKKVGNYYVNISQIRGHVNLKSDREMLLDDFYTIITKDEKVTNSVSKHIYFSFDSYNEANNFIEYLKTDFCRFALSIYKNNSQLDRGELSAIPWFDFSKKIDESVLFNQMDSQEILFIKSKINKYYI